MIKMMMTEIIIVNNVNRQKAVNSIEYLKKLGYKILQDCTYDDYLKHGNKHMYFVSDCEYIYQGNCNDPYTKEELSTMHQTMNHIVYYEDIFKKQMDIE